MENDECLKQQQDRFEIDPTETERVSGAGWGGAVFGAYMGAEFGPAGMVAGAVLGHMMLD